MWIYYTFQPPRACGRARFSLHTKTPEKSKLGGKNNEIASKSDQSGTGTKQRGGNGIDRVETNEISSSTSACSRRGGQIIILARIEPVV
jgi:hypothetical protein